MTVFRSTIRVFSLLLLCLVMFPANAGSLPESSAPFIIEPGFTYVSRIGLHMDLFEDKEGKLDIEDVIRAASEGKFHRSEHLLQTCHGQAKIFHGRPLRRKFHPEERYLV